jgi:LAO/AO transport system kinase
MVHERAGMGHEIPVLKTSAIENSGIEDLAAAIDHCLRSTTGIHEKQLHLLAEKAWQLIQAQKMKGVDRSALMEELKKHLAGEGPFNLYSFIKTYI